MSISAQPMEELAKASSPSLEPTSQRGTLLSRVRTLKSLRRAFEKVARNKKAAAGIDDVSVSAFGQQKEMQLRAISRSLRDGTFRFAPLRPVAIPKKDKKAYRPILIPTVADRIVQRSILHQVTRYVGPLIDHRTSHAFRADFGVKSAVQQLATGIAGGNWVVLIVDIENFFGAINGDRLFSELLAVLPDASLEPLLRQLQHWELNDLTSLPVFKRGCFPQAGKGVPQGSALSPILSNFFLRDLDAQAAEKRIPLVRYADDIAVACKTVEEANSVFLWISDHLQSRGLTIHPIGHKKSRRIELGVNGVAGVEYLGLYLSPVGRSEINISISSASFARAKNAVADCFDVTSAANLAERFEELTYFLSSWLGTYSHVCSTDSERAQLIEAAQRGLSSLLTSRELLAPGQGLTREQRAFLGVDSIFEKAEIRRRRASRQKAKVKR